MTEIKSQQNMCRIQQQSTITWISDCHHLINISAGLTFHTTKCSHHFISSHLNCISSHSHLPITGNGAKAAKDVISMACSLPCAYLAFHRIITNVSYKAVTHTTQSFINTIIYHIFKLRVFVGDRKPNCN